MDENLKEELVERFRDYLTTGYEPEPDLEPVDMYALFTELSGLKNEVRIESRQVKTALDEFRQAFMAMDGANQDLRDMMQRLGRQKEGQKTGEIQSVLVHGLMDLYDRIRSAMEQAPPDPGFFERLSGDGRQRRWIQAQVQGQEMLAERVLALLKQCGVDVLPVGETFTPATMHAVGFSTDPSLPDGHVLREVRKGFVEGERLLRPAEVIVNKHQER